MFISPMQWTKWREEKGKKSKGEESFKRENSKDEFIV